MNRDADRSMVQSASNNVGNAIRMGKGAAQTAKAITKAAASAAAGNIPGAAVEVLKNSETARTAVKIIIAPLIIFITVLVCSLYALPTVVYDAVQSYYSSLEEEWKLDVYSSEKGYFAAALVSTSEMQKQITIDIAKTIWSGLKSLFTPNQGDVDDKTDNLSEDAYELRVTYDEKAQKDTLNEKIDGCINKLKLRSQQLESAIYEQSNAIDDYFKAKYSDIYDEWGGTTTSVYVNDITRAEAVSLLSAYTVINNASLNSQKLSDFMRWLGYQNELDFMDTVSFNIGGDYTGITGNVKKWRGTFMPQYLVEQQKYEIETFGTEMTNFSQYMCASVDMLLIVDGPDFDSIQPLLTNEVRYYKYFDEELKEFVVEPYDVIIATVNVQIFITTRNINSFASEVIGLWDGALVTHS